MTSFTLQESVEVLQFGNFRSSFSTAVSGESGWFYGSHSSYIPDYHWSNADVWAGATLPLDVQALNYQENYIFANEGDVVVFRHGDEYAYWKLDSFDSCDPAPCSILHGDWGYIETSSHAAAPIPEPSALTLMLVGLIVIRFWMGFMSETNIA